MMASRERGDLRSSQGDIWSKAGQWLGYYRYSCTEYLSAKCSPCIIQNIATGERPSKISTTTKDQPTRQTRKHRPPYEHSQNHHS